MSDEYRCNVCGEINEQGSLTCKVCGQPLSRSTTTLVHNLNNPTIPTPETLPERAGNPAMLPTGHANEPILQRSAIANEPAEPIDEIEKPTGPGPGRQISLNNMPLWLKIGLVALPILLILALFFRFPGGSTSSGGQTSTSPTATPTPQLPRLPDGPGTVLFPNGEYVGVNDGLSHPFDTERQDPQQLRLQAMQAAQKADTAASSSLWHQYLSGQNENDAEVQIYLQNQGVAQSQKKHITMLLGLDFPVPSPDSSASSDAIMAMRSAMQGAYVAQKEFNDQHGDIQLRLLLVNTGDDKSYVAPLVQQIKNSIAHDQTVVGIIGWQTSVRTQGVLDALRQNGMRIPIISQSASSDHLTENTPPNFFRISPLNKAQAQAAYLVATRKLHATQAIVFIDPGDPFSQNIGQDFERSFPNYSEVNFTIERTKAAKFSMLLQNALKNVHDLSHLVVFFTGPTNYDGLQFQDALSSYPSLPVIAGDAGYIVHNKTIYNRWYIIAYAFHDEWKALLGNNAAFFQEYSDAFNSDGNPNNAGAYGYGLPNAPAIISYDAVRVLEHGIDIALKTSASPTQQDLENALTGITTSQPWQGVSGQIAFDAHHDASDRALIVLNVDGSGHLQMLCIQGTFANNASNAIRQCGSL